MIPTVQDKALDAKFDRQMRIRQEAAKHIGEGVSDTAQSLYDALSKTYVRSLCDRRCMRDLVLTRCMHFAPLPSPHLLPSRYPASHIPTG